MSERKLGLGMSDYDKRNEELEQILAGVMHFVDKWLEADDFDKDEVTRAAIVYEKVSQRLKARDATIKDLYRAQGHGYWYLLDECANAGVYCSVCHKKVYKEHYANVKPKSKFCPNCGSMMDREFVKL